MIKYFILIFSILKINKDIKCEALAGLKAKKIISNKN